MPPRIRRWRVPDSRLPFVNVEMAQTVFAGEPHMVSSIWGGTTGGRLHFWNPETGSRAMRELPEKIPGAYMLRQGPDRKLYLGCGRGELVRYDPERDNFDILITGEMHSITWGGCVTDRYVVWSASPGETAVYDWREQKLVHVFRPMDTQRPEALYGHRVVEAPDGCVLVGMDVPQARVILLDPASMTVESVTPPEILGHGSTRGAAFLDDETLALFAGDLLVYRYPSFELIDRIAEPAGAALGGRECMVGGKLYVSDSRAGNLYRLDRERSAWELLAPGWSGEGWATLGSWKDEAVCGVSVQGMTWCYDVASGETTSLDLEATGPMTCHALCPVPELDLIVGAPFINQRFWTIDMVTGEGVDRGRAAPGGGQINQIVWDSRLRTALLSSYTTASVTSYDPAKPAGWPENPRLVASAHDEGQMRPMALAFDGRYAWMATSPEYGTLGGALCRIDPKAGDIETWRHIVPDQKINGLVLDLDRRRVFCSSDISADCNSAPPTQTTGRILAFDLDACEVIRSREVVEGCPSCHVLVVTHHGEALVGAEGRLYVWTPDTDELRDAGEWPERMQNVVRIGHEYWTSALGWVGRLHVDEAPVRFEPIIERSANFLQEAGGSLYYSTGYEIEAVPVAELLRMAPAE